VTNGSIKGGITWIIKNSGKLCQLITDILWKWEMPKKRKICLLKSYCSQY
jgi:hypothetical protein